MENLEREKIMNLNTSKIKKYNKIATAGKKPIMVRVNQNWYTWAEGDPKYGVLLTTQDGEDVEFDFKQIDDIQEGTEKLTKSKLKAVVEEVINEAGMFTDYHELNPAYMSKFIKNYMKLNSKNLVKKSGSDTYGFRKGEREAHWKFDDNYKLYYSIDKVKALGLINFYNRAKKDHPWG